MRYNFKRCDADEWIGTIKCLRRRGTSFLEVPSAKLYEREEVSDVSVAYFSRTSTSCKIVYYTWEDRWKKNLREISFSPREIDPVKCVATFQKIAKSFNESLNYEKENVRYTNGVYCYNNGAYSGYATSLDMNSAYLFALSQPLADYTTRTEVELKDVVKKEFDYYCFKNELHNEIFYKDDERMIGAYFWENVKVYGFRGKVYFEKTCKELYRLKRDVNKEKYKNVANITVGCFHKRSGKRNNSTLAASLYAWFAYYIGNLVSKFESNGYKVVTISTDCVKIKGRYNTTDNIVRLGEGLGEFKVEYEGEAKYYSVGHYEEDKVKWKGKPQYLIAGYEKCNFIDTPEKERKIYERFAIK